MLDESVFANIEWHRYDDYRGTLKERKSICCSDLLQPDDSHREKVITIPHTSWSDYVGTTAERSNYRVLLTEWQWPGVYPCSGGYGGHSLMVNVCEMIDWTEEQVIEFADWVRTDYPLVDDQDHSALEQEMKDDEWPEFEAELVETIGEVEGAYEAYEEHWFAETAVSGYCDIELVIKELSAD